METRQWEQVYHIMGDKVFQHFYQEYMVFVRGGADKNSLIQISGVSIFDYMKDKFGKDAVYE